MRDAASDVRYGLRLLRRQPGYTLVAALTMALGIGATTTLFSVANGVLLKPLPWPDADRLVRVIETRQGKPARIPGTISNAAFLAWNETPASTIENLGGYGTNIATASPGGAAEPRRVQFARVTPAVFPLLRATPMRGRLFDPSEGPSGSRGAPDNPRVAILSYGLWQEWFGGRDDAIGRAVSFDGIPLTVIGVMPRTFAFPDRDTRAWLPMSVGAVLGEQGVRRIAIFSALARLRPGVSLAQAAAEGTSRARSAPDPGLAAVGMFGSASPPDLAVVRAADALTADVRPAILVLMAAVALLLMSATGNVAGVQLARATTRRREMAVRAALGAGIGRLTRQLVIESSLVASAGGLLGLGLAFALLRGLKTILPPDFPRLEDVSIDSRVLLFTSALSLATGIVCGVLPAIQARRLALTEALASESGAIAAGAGRTGGARTRRAIMIGQVAVACILMVGAALLTRSFRAMLRADRGYDPSGVLTARVDLPAGYDAARRVGFAEAVTARLRAHPGVVYAAAGNALPFMSMGGNSAFEMRSPIDPSVKVPVQTMTRVVGADYFSVMQLRLLAGRPLRASDSAASAPVVVVNRSFARRYLGERPVGARLPLPFGAGRPDCEVVGVVDDMRQGSVTDPQVPELFASYQQLPNRLVTAPMFLVVRTNADPAALAPAIRSLVREQDSALAIDSVMTMDQRVMTSLARPRTYALLLAAFAVSALAIAGVGLFGVLSFAVAQRAREIGVRTALGARPRDIVGLVLKQAGAIALPGIAIGLAASSALARYARSFLYGVSEHDAWTSAMVAIVLAAGVAVACVAPARRAARLNPLDVLRAQ
jgi:putative ABC transport system permease protein